MKNDPEIAGKRPYSFLQWAEQKDRNIAKDKKIIFEKSEDFCAAGIQQEKDRVWVLLNYSDKPNGVYILPDKNYILTQHDYFEMEKFCKIDTKVSLELKQHLVDNK